MNKQINITNEYATLITDNRFIAKAQLDADDMGASTWKQYRQLCDNIAIASWNGLCGRTNPDDNTVGMSLTGLFAFFGSDAMATVDMQNRFLLACVKVKKVQSEEMKQARKNLRSAKNLLEEAQDAEPVNENMVELYQEKVKECEEIVATMELEPHNVWYDKTPMLDKTFKHATAQCRKLIEDTMADIITERELMTAEQKQAEAQRLADERKGRKIRKQNEAKAAAQSK
jgi:hypothetical protein